MIGRVDVGHDRADRIPELGVVDRLLETITSRRHQRRVERSAHRERHCPLGAQFLGDLARTSHIVGHTGDASGALSFADDRGMGVLKGRAVVQSGASFYRDRYTSSDGFDDLPAWRSSDRELSPLRSWSIGTRAEWSFDGRGKLLRLTPGVRVARTAWVYPEFSELPRRVGWLAGGGVDAEF